MANNIFYEQRTDIENSLLSNTSSSIRHDSIDNADVSYTNLIYKFLHFLAMKEMETKDSRHNRDATDLFLRYTEPSWNIESFIKKIDEMISTRTNDTGVVFSNKIKQETKNPHDSFGTLLTLSTELNKYIKSYIRKIDQMISTRTDDTSVVSCANNSSYESTRYGEVKETRTKDRHESIDRTVVSNNPSNESKQETKNPQNRFDTFFELCTKLSKNIKSDIRKFEQKISTSTDDTTVESCANSSNKSTRFREVKERRTKGRQDSLNTTVLDSNLGNKRKQETKNLHISVGNLFALCTEINKNIKSYIIKIEQRITAHTDDTLIVSCGNPSNKVKSDIEIYGTDEKYGMDGQDVIDEQDEMDRQDENRDVSLRNIDILCKSYIEHSKEIILIIKNIENTINNHLLNKNNNNKLIKKVGMKRPFTRRNNESGN